MKESKYREVSPTNRAKPHIYWGRFSGVWIISGLKADNPNITSLCAYIDGLPNPN